jgi:hypothetical protein
MSAELKRVLNNKNIFKQNNIIFNMKDKRGQGMQINTVIMIVLGLALLIILILGFTVGWNKFLPWLSTDNIQTVVTQCQVACTTNSQYGFCTQKRTVNDGETDIALDVTCAQLSSDAQYSSIGVTTCSQITCPVTTE